MKIGVLRRVCFRGCRTLGVWLVTVALSGCGSGADSSRVRVEGEVEESGPEVSRGPIIDPGAQVGDTIGGLEIVSAALSPVPGEAGVWVGEVRFSGTVHLSGARRPHPSDEELGAVCFFPDSSSASRLPRLRSDERVSWFCFSNPDAAESLAIHPPSAQQITVDDYTYNYSFSDVFNTARLVSVGPSSDHDSDAEDAES